MKSTERHKLKENDFRQSVARTRALVAERQNEIAVVVVIVLAVVVAVGAFTAWRASRNARAANLLASALVVAESPVVAPPPPAPGSAPPVQQPGTFRSEGERAEAALPKLLQAADAYPNADAGITARYRAASILAEIGRFAEAEQRYQEVIAKTGRSGIYARTARLGLGETQLAQGKNDAAIATFRELSTDGDSPLPLDGVLMQLGLACAQAGRKDEAARALTRVVDEFPQSPYASEAKERLQELKKSAA